MPVYPSPLAVSPLFGTGDGAGPPTMRGEPRALVTLQLPLPEIHPIPDAHEFNVLGGMASAAVGTVTLPGVTVEIPDGSLAVIRGVSFYLTDMLLTTDLRFTLRINGAAPSGYGGVQIFPRIAPYVGTAFDAMIRFQGSATVDVQVTNLDGGLYTVGAAISGWYWPEASDKRWRTLGR